MGFRGSFAAGRVRRIGRAIIDRLPLQKARHPMVCPRCGSEVPSSLNRCPGCGAGHVRTTAAGLQTPPPPTARTPAPAFMADDAPTAIPLPSAPIPDPERHTPLHAAAGDGFVDPELTIQPGSGGAPHADRGPLDIGSAFGARYHIIRLLGIGGMGAVYQAWDAELGVAVAIKVIRPEVMADPTAAAEVERRFKRELLLARQVTHKNVVRIHDLGEIRGIKYITMPYVDGADLATISRNEGHLPIPRILRIARGIASGLVAAHTASVVHRDLKPANIMVGADNEAMIMDFGIALSAGTPSASATVVEGLPTQFKGSVARFSTTMAGAVVGTVEYMAPEQAKGQPVDQRADIYAFGLMLYDLLVGRRRAEHAPSAIAELQGRMEQPPPPPRTVVPEIPEALDQLVARCLEPDPAKRYQTSAELAAALERLDENGVPIPLPRRFTPRMIAASVVLVAGLVTATWWLTRTPPPPKQHNPVSVLIADFQNQTGDAMFDRSLEPVLKLALEGAGFITAYDRSGVRNLGASAVEKLDDATAQQIAVKQGVGVVILGSVQREGESYGISVKAVQAVTGNVIATATNRASGKDKVLGAATKLATTVRTALGDETSKSDAQIFAMDTLSATNLDVVRQYAVGTEWMAKARWDEALQSFSNSVKLDGNFGMGYQGMALASRNLDRDQDAEKYIKEALRHLDQMTERERFRARGFFYRITGDYPACVKEYGDLIARYAADVAAHNQLALCSTFLRNLPRAVDEMRQVVKIVPKTTTFRDNLALYLSYSSDFQTAEHEAQGIENGGVNSLLALAFGQLGQGQAAQANETYQKLAAINAQGASRAASGTGDVALYEGRFAEAARILGQGAAADLAAKEPNRAAAKFVALAYAQVSRKQNDAAIAAADSALKSSPTVKIRFLAGRALVEAGEIAKAQTVAASLAGELQTAPQAHAKIIEGLIFLKRRDARQAIKVLTEANVLLDTWIGHFELGRAYLEAGQYIKGDSEFDRCIKRRGEAMSLFLDEEPTYGYLPAVYYYQGRVREGLNSAGFADSYREYLKIRGESKDDPLVPDARRRAGA
jgi:eukaryotic-like serine/threonine-protein kinase